MRVCLILLLVCLLQSPALAQVDHWETLVLAGDTWKYMPGTSQPASDWQSTGFDDNGWESGPGGIGYGDEDDNTIISPVISLYMRLEFNITDKDQIDQLLLQADYDDGFIAYLNGVEIARSGFSNYNGQPPHDMPVDQSHEAVMYQGGLPENYPLDENAQALLTNGINTLAFQVHNRDISSSDLTSRFFLFAGMNAPGLTYRELPPFFREPVRLSTSNLPIIKIDTEGSTIRDEPRIQAQMQVINNGPGIVNRVEDAPTDYDGRIAIEIRGSSSQMFPKKSFRLELQDAAGENNNVPLLGMPAENDWILYAPYSDKSMLRNVLTFHLGRELVHYAPRTRFAELTINGEYQGVYVLMETIKRDNDRVNIANLREEDISGDELTGGYIVKVDRPDPEGGNWQGFYPNGEAYHQYQIVYPKPRDIRSQQLEYIRNFMRNFETLAFQGNINSNEFQSIIDLPSFVDFFLINEFSLNVDAYRLSAFFYKDKITDGGKLFAGPLWDFNLAFGNADYCEAWKTTGWVFRGSCDGGVPFFWPKLVENKSFIDNVQARWISLRQQTITEDRLHQYIDSVALTLEASQSRNYERWPILGSWIWPNYYVGDTFQEEINYLKNWISARLRAMDNQIAALEPVFDYRDLLTYQVRAYPNPFSETLNIKYAVAIPGEVRLEVIDITGRIVSTESLGRQSTGYYHVAWSGENNSMEDQPDGLYLVRVTLNGNALAVKRVIKE